MNFEVYRPHYTVEARNDSTLAGLTVTGTRVLWDSLLSKLRQTRGKAGDKKTNSGDQLKDRAKNHVEEKSQSGHSKLP